MLALQFERSAAAYALVRAAGGRPEVATGELSMLHLGDVPEPALPGPDWVRVKPRLSGICGSDLAAITAHASMYLEPLTSYPFVPGHELVGELEDGTRVVLEPVLGCRVRGIDPPCARCVEGSPGLCENLTEGALAAGLQTGYCATTGGGWGEVLVAHRSQLHEVPDTLADEAAVLIEPFSCAIHAALRGGARDDETVLVHGAGAIGLLTVAAVRRFTPPGRLMAVAKHPHQRHLALELGADQVVSPDDAMRRVRFATGARRVEGRELAPLLGGVDLTLECVGSAEGLGEAIGMTRAGGRLVVVGMPGRERVDWAPIWQRELHVTGAYAYGVEPQVGGRRTFDLALEEASDVDLGRLSGPNFRLGEYREAIAYAAAAGPLGAVRVCFDLRGH
ncbi:MAG: zinc-dependent alcohol dehydrogenase [Candidatus Dormibacteraceae bacterium]